MPSGRRGAVAKSRVTTLLDRAGQHLDSGNLEALRKDVERLNTLFPRRSVEESNQLDRLGRRILRALRDGLPLDEFLETAQLSLFPRSDVYKILDAVAGRFELEQIFAIVSALGTPPREKSPIREMLTTSDDPRIIPWLDQAIRQAARVELHQGVSLHQHQRTMSSFQLVRWQPDDRGLSDAIRLLAERSEPGAEVLLHQYLKEMPWGSDRPATGTLLDAITGRRSEAGEEAVRRALARHTEPGPLRLYLIEALGVWSRAAAVDMAVLELGRDLESDTRLDLLALLDRHLEDDDESAPLDLAAIGEGLRGLDTRAWSSLERGGLAEVAAHVPGARAGEFAGVGDRFVAGLIGSFMVFRLEHMGCLVTLPLAALLGWGAIFVLDRVLARPSRGLALLEVAALLIWLLVLAATSHTHFSGHESPRQRLYMASVFWGATVAVPLVMLTIRLPGVDLAAWRPLVLPGTILLASLAIAIPLGRRAPWLLVSLVLISAGLGAVWRFGGAGHLPAIAVWLAQVGTALVGWAVGWMIGAACSGSERFDLPFGSMVLIPLLVGILAPWFGWGAVAWVVGAYVALSIVGGLAERLGA